MVNLLQFCIEHGYHLRIIEQMPLDAGHRWDRGKAVSADEVLIDAAAVSTARPTRAPGVSAGELWRVDGGPADGRRHRIGVTRILLGM